MKIEMTLLSDSIPGSGEGIAGIIDSDIIYDEFGIPFIPAKRIKGILKESARDLLDVGKLPQTQIDKLFGVRGSEKGTYFKISDGYVSDYDTIRVFLKVVNNNYKKAAALFNPEAVLDYFSYTRSQTTINEDGVAQEDTLRTFRILKRGLTFSFDVVCPAEHKIDLTRICKVTRSFGTSRTRGAGAIKLELIDEDIQEETDVPDNDDQTTFQDDDLCDITLDIHNKSQLLVTQQVGKTQDSEDYIPGSFILGALAGQFISEHSLDKPHDDKDFWTIFLSGQVRFLDAYPCQIGGRTYWPCPQSFVKEKDNDNHFDLTDPDNIEKIVKNKKQTKGKIGPYIEIGGNDIEYVTPETEVEYHHQRPKNRSIGHATDDSGDFFQFTVIKPDQHFRATIFGEYKYLKPVFELLQKNNILYLGKSRTAQYGRCECTAEIALKSTSSKTWKKGETAVITLISDIILRNGNGMTAAYPELLVQEIRELRVLPKNSDGIKLMASFTYANKLGGYLGVWNMPKIQTVALAAGSEIVCQNNTDVDIPAEELEKHAFGFRTEEGFGRIRFNWHNKTDIDTVKKATSSFALSDVSSNVSELVKHILDKELETTVINYATEQFRLFKGTHITNSFIGRLKLLINRSCTFDNLNDNIRFSKRAFEQLKRLKKYWHLNETKDENNNDILVVHAMQFTRALLQIQKPNTTPELGNLMREKLNIDTIYLSQDNNQQLSLYKIFANHFLTLARLHNRKQEV